MNPATANRRAAASHAGVEARLARRAAEVAEQRRSGNGTAADVAAFCCVSERTVIKWKDEGIIGHTQIGQNLWFSADDVADLATHHHQGKYSTIAPTEVPNRVRRDWREFLGAADRDQVVMAELTGMRAAFKQYFPDAFGAVAVGNKTNPSGGGPLVHSAAASVNSDNHKKAA